MTDTTDRLTRLEALAESRSEQLDRLTELLDGNGREGICSRIIRLETGVKLLTWAASGGAIGLLTLVRAIWG